MATFMPSRALIPSCWLSPESGPWKPILTVPLVGWAPPAPAVRLHWAWADLPPEPLSLLLQAVRTSGITIAPAATDASRRVVDSRTVVLLEEVRGSEFAPSGGDGSPAHR